MLGGIVNDPNRLSCCLYPIRESLVISGESNKQGWGIGYIQEDEVLVKKRPEAADRPINFFDLTRDLIANIFIGHVRTATVGGWKIENTHPFRYRSWMFAHQGTIEHFSNIKKHLLSSIPNFLSRNIRGETDSEHLFHLFLSRIHDKGVMDDPNLDVKVIAEALKGTIAHIDAMAVEAGGKEHSAINIMVSNGRVILATCRGRPLYVYSSGGVDDCELCQNASLKGGASYKKKPHEYQRSVILASEVAGPILGWEEVAGNSMVMVNQKLDVEQIPL